ncbi:MAG: hypothetical protein UU72_C0008G0043 [candidate division WWE3 bacterium GW2011_GWB1_41_6]|uniref:Glycoside hydrolase family 5 domain-containing protein n=1 Tax=candidate division WWE3 bacterium GW2011_GWB1_41_6 TaxID=1619112 RepID=A0A0G0Z4P5_UNCKA|nr:MAG: hypothetical protein UU72_C0008G0043 [candidate division WWE3 bacterium GW2011_GWB1_41_6]
MGDEASIFGVDEAVLGKKPDQCEIHGSIEYLYYENTGFQKVKNNKVGLYIYAEKKSFFELAQKLVNSNGGDWGYVLVPYNVRDRDVDKWKEVFRMTNDKHLVPIIQLHEVNPDNYEKETNEAAQFLNQFMWPIRNRYISIYNEPNDSRFWGGKVDPKEYAVIMRYTIAAFKKENLDFFMINGALNTSASTNEVSTDAEIFMKKMNEKVPGIFNQLDGWASHSYPQPNFSGKPDGKGRLSIRAYESELDFLKKEMGVKKELPVFITETGWAHAEGESYNSSYLTAEFVGKYFKQAYEKVWMKDDRVWAVTPFTIWYEPPYDHFSWVNRDGVPYEHYEVVKSIKKVKGTPAKLETGNEVSLGCPPKS